jgi:hypothetical protein
MLHVVKSSAVEVLQHRKSLRTSPAAHYDGYLGAMREGDGSNSLSLACTVPWIHQSFYGNAKIRGDLL